MNSNPVEVAQLIENQDLSAEEAIRIATGTADAVQILHESGQLHREISVDAISIDNTTQQVSLMRPSDKEFLLGKNNFDQEQCPPEFRNCSSIQIPNDLKQADKIIQQAGLTVDPRRIDVYQLGVLLWRLLTNEPISSFLSSPRFQGQVASDIRKIIEQALGHSKKKRFSSTEQFLKSIGHLLNGNTGVDDLPPEGIPSDQSSPSLEDTAPSIIHGKLGQDTDLPSGSPSIERTDGQLPFEKLGHYEILEKIGHGGMGDVYKGYEQSLDRTVAIKVLPSDFARHDEFVKRFYAEATAAARLSHSNVIEIHYIGEDQNHHFFAMQYVEGESLADLLSREHRTDIPNTLVILEQALAGLSAAHKFGLVHRDIKPGNLLLDKNNNRVLLADFGLVKSLQEISKMTATGVVMGTVDYISPEQGRGLNVDARSDLYSIGVLMYRMLSGRLPFEADSPTGVIFQHVYETAEPLHRIVRDIPPALVSIVEKMMAKSPEDRYQSAEEILTDLRAFQADKPLPSGADICEIENHSQESAIHSSVGHRGGVDGTFRPTTIISAPQFDSDPSLPSNLSETAPTGWWGRLKNKAIDFFEEKAPEFVNQLQNTQQQVDGAVREYERRRINLGRLTDEAEGVLDELLQQEQSWISAAKRAKSEADAESESARKQDALEHIIQCEQKARELNQQNQEQQNQLETMRMRMAKITATLERLRSQKDLLNARLKMAQAQLRLASGVSGTSVWKRLFRRHFRTIAGSVLVVVLFSVAVRLFFVKSPEILSTSAQPNSSTPIGTQQANSSSSVRNHSKPANEPIFRFPGQSVPVGAIAVSSADTSFFASADHDGEIRLWDMVSGDEQATLKGHPGKVLALAVSPDGQTMVSGGEPGRDESGSLAFWDLKFPEKGTFVDERTGIVSDLSFHPEGNVVAALHTSQDSSQQLKLWNTSTAEMIQNIEVDFSISRIAYHPEGAILALGTHDGTIKFWDIKQRTITKVYKSDEAPTQNVTITCLEFHPNGKFFVSGDSVGRVQIWDILFSKPRTFLAHNRRPNKPLIHIRTLKFSKNGHFLAIADSERMHLRDLQFPHLRMRTFSVSDIESIAFDNDGRWLFTGGSQSFLTKWDANLDPIVSKEAKYSVKHSRAISVDIMPDQETFLIGGGLKIGIWDPKGTGRFIRFSEPAEEIDYVSVSPDGKLAAGGGKNGALCLWDVASGRIKRQINLTTDGDAESGRKKRGSLRVLGLDFTPDGKDIVISTPRKVVFWNTETGAEELRLKGEQNTIYSLAVSSDERYLATGGYDSADRTAEIRLWDLRTGKQIRRIVTEGTRIKSLSFSWDGQFLLTGRQKSVQLWEVNTGSLQREFTLPKENPYFANAVRFSPDGKRIAASGDGRISLWNVKNGDELYRIEWEGGSNVHRVSSLEFTPNGKYIVTGGFDGTAHVWQAMNDYEIDKRKYRKFEF